MALRQKSLFLYGFQVTELNRSIDFRAVAAETPRQASLRLGYYSLSALMTEVERAMQEADASRRYTVTADRTIAGGLENRVRIESDGAHMELLFGSGPRTASSAASLLGFAAADRTGATQYAGSFSAGTVLVPSHVGYDFVSPEFNQEVFGNVNVSVSGAKEAIVFNVQKLLSVEFRFEPVARVRSEWVPFMTWAIRQRLFEFTPEISDPSTYYEVTLESTDFSGKGLGFRMSEMLPALPGHYKTGPLKMRVKT